MACSSLSRCLSMRKGRWMKRASATMIPTIRIAFRMIAVVSVMPASSPVPLRNYCPVEASRLNDVVRSLPPGSRPAIVAVSVNVFGNARRYLLQDIHKWKLGGEFRWGVGTPSQLGAVWKRYDIGVLDQSKKIAGVEVHNIVHTEAAYIVDAHGYERALYLWPFTAADVLKVLRTSVG